MGPFWGHFGGFEVKTLCNPGLQGNLSQQRKWYTTNRGSSQRSSEDRFCAPCVSRAQIEPLEDLRDDPRWVVRRFLCWLGFPGRPGLHHFHRKSQQMAKMTQTHLKKRDPLFCTFFILYLYNFFPGAGRSLKVVFFKPQMWERG